jgi:muramoyltetrapeptide carboxypeptidase
VVATHVPRCHLIHEQPRSSRARRPPLLSEGARVALVAPAGPLRGDADLARAVDNVRSFGWEPVVGEHALARNGYFAGVDSQRALDLNVALRDDSIDAVWCLRGGYGTMRILDTLDYDAVTRRPKPIIGYSDITALHAAVSRRSDVVTYHGPTARAALSPFSRESLACALVHGGDSCGIAADARVLRGGTAQGILAGGNLALLSALVGTPFAPRLDDSILVLEDVDEAVYRVDRMLRQLLLAGTLDGVRGIAFGTCTNCPETSDDGARRLDDVIVEIAELLEVPAIAGIPVGHMDDQWTLPLGAHAVLDTGRRTLAVQPTLTIA